GWINWAAATNCGKLFGHRHELQESLPSIMGNTPKTGLLPPGIRGTYTLLDCREQVVWDCWRKTGDREIFVDMQHLARE
ncbi:MAG TPA: hypothetical protein VFU32_07970, partial [Ktedonobacterales bacterium]|nr:hypothetical protein [Ktedonobacterales bacterium]